MSAGTAVIKKQILLIEDDPGFRSLVSAYLVASEDTLTLHEAGSLADGLALLRRQPFDAILLDLNLPDSKGLETIKLVNGEHSQIPIVVLTASDNDSLAVQLLQHGAQEYVVKKPERLETLNRTLLTAIERNRIDQRLRLFECAVMNASDAVLIAEVSEEGRLGQKIVFYNDEFQKLMGYDDQELIGETIRSIYEAGTKAPSFLEEHVRNLMPCNASTVHIKKDGTSVEIDLTLFPVGNKNGKITHWVSIHRDASIRKRNAERERRFALMEQKEDFASLLAHDLKTPVAGAVRVFEALLNGSQGNLNEPQTKLLQALRNSNDGLLQKIHNVIGLYRFDKEHQDLTLCELDVKPIIKQTIAKFATPLEKKNIKVHVVSDEALPPVMADDDALETLLSQLLDNAIKFSAADSKIIITATPVDETLQIAVSDSGRGIAKKDQTELFSRLWQGGQDNQYTAVIGLGLFLCNQIVQAHHGNIQCDSDSGRGATFTFSLPAQPLRHIPTTNHFAHSH